MLAAFKASGQFVKLCLEPYHSPPTIETTNVDATSFFMWLWNDNNEFADQPPKNKNIPVAQCWDWVTTQYAETGLKNYFIYDFQKLVPPPNPENLYNAYIDERLKIFLGGEFKMVTISVREVTVTSDVSTIDIDGLDLDTDKGYLLIFKTKNPTGSDTAYRIFFNGDYNEANYYTQDLFVGATTVAGARVNRSQILYLRSGREGFCKVWIMRSIDGYPQVIAQGIRHRGDGIEQMSDTIARSVVGNVTTLRISSAVAGAIGAGSKLLVYKVT